jgi:SAM-dependent methyltransferase
MNTTYTEDQYDTCYPPGIERHWWTIARSAQVSRIVRVENNSGDVFLEVGCGKGLEVKALRKAGINVYGVELAAVQPLEGMEPFVSSGVDAIQLPIAQRERVTGLLLLDVIEHLPDPVAFLKKLESKFPKLSVVVIAVPASQELWSNFDEYYGHYRRYTTQMLEELGYTLGWELRKSGYFFHLLYIPIRVLSWLGVERQTVMRAPGPTMRWLHRLIASVNWLDNCILPRTLKGTSAFAVYRLG